MKSVSIPSPHRRARHAARNGHRDVTGRVEAIAVALFLRMLRHLIPSLRSMLPPSRDILTWQLHRRAVARAAEQRRRERRRRVAIATTVVGVGAAAAAGRALSRR